MEFIMVKPVSQHSRIICSFYNMRIKIIFLFFFLMHMSKFHHAQVPIVKSWDYRYGGSDWDIPTVFLETLDHGYLCGGYSRSNSSFDKLDSLRGGEDYWILKTDANGIIQWEKTFGGSQIDFLTTILALPDSGFLLGGRSNSGQSGDRTTPNANTLSPKYDYWIVRIDKLGNKIWDKSYGGFDDDYLESIHVSSDGSFYLGGYTDSDSSGDMSHHKFGAEDMWVVKIDSLGNVLWDRNYGGINSDLLFSIIQFSGNEILLAGTSSSPPGHTFTQPVCGSSGNDMWLIKIDTAGNVIQDKRIGGPDWDWNKGMCFMPANKFLIYGYSASGIGCEKNSTNHGFGLYQDFWIVCMDDQMNILWDRSLGGDNAEDELNSVIVRNDQILVSGTSYSNASGDKSQNNILNMEQAWIIALDTLGNKKWDRIIANPVHTEYCAGFQGSDSCYVFLSMAETAGGEVSQNRSSTYDYWLVKYCPQSALPTADFSVSETEICQNTCIDLVNNSVNALSFQWYFPGGAPSTDTSANPENICYFNSGMYDIELITTNANGSDTLVLNNVITVFPAISFSSLTQSGDTLFSMPGFVSYQWFSDSIAINGATNYFYVAPYSGNYSVKVTDGNGCEAVATLLGVVASANDVDSEIEINYKNSRLDIYGEKMKNCSSVDIFDVLGKQIYFQTMQPESTKRFSLNIELPDQGIFVIVVNFASGRICKKLVIR